MKKLFFVLLFQMFFIHQAYTQIVKYPLFQKVDTAAIPYRLLLPQNYDSTQTYPLVLFLHGAGSRGIDNKLHLTHIAQLFLNNKNREKFPCFVLAPQCPKGKRWVEVDWGLNTHTMPKKQSVAMTNAIKVLEKVQKSMQLILPGFMLQGYLWVGLVHGISSCVILLYLQQLFLFVEVLMIQKLN